MLGVAVLSPAYLTACRHGFQVTQEAWASSKVHGRKAERGKHGKTCEALETTGPKRREVSVLEREECKNPHQAVLLERQAASVMNKVKESIASAETIQEDLKATFASSTSLVEAAKSIVADVAVLKIKTRIAHEEIIAKVKDRLHKMARQDLHKRYATEAIEELKQLKPMGVDLLTNRVSADSRDVM